MRQSLFARLTGRGDRAAAAGGLGSAAARLFESARVLARSPALYRDGGVPDTLDGRFAALASALALLIIRIEREGEPGNILAARVTERFVAVMDAEHRELGFGDPTVGKTVRKLVSRLGKTIEVWRCALESDNWRGASIDALGLSDAGDDQQIRSSEILRLWWNRLDEASWEKFEEGTVE